MVLKIESTHSLFFALGLTAQVSNRPSDWWGLLRSYLAWKNLHGAIMTLKVKSHKTDGETQWTTVCEPCQPIIKGKNKHTNSHPGET